MVRLQEHSELGLGNAFVCLIQTMLAEGALCRGARLADVHIVIPEQKEDLVQDSPGSTGLPVVTQTSTVPVVRWTKVLIIPRRAWTASSWASSGSRKIDFEPVDHPFSLASANVFNPGSIPDDRDGELAGAAALRKIAKFESAHRWAATPNCLARILWIP